MRLARIVSNQSRAIVVIVALLCAAGIYAAWQLPIAVFPQTDFPRIVIIVDNGEAPASQTLVSVTRPIEEAMNGIPGIARIKSKTARGSSEINLYFDWNGNINAGVATGAGADVATIVDASAHRRDSKHRTTDLCGLSSYGI